jgi:DNA/RNA endonuclease YhcR with UshA esterase domain
MDRQLTPAAVGVALWLALTAVPVHAHHSFAAEFDANQPVTIKGTVTAMDWVNPHSWIHIDVKNPDGTVTQWMIEGGTPNTLFRRGFTKDSLKAGTEIVVEGYRAKNGKNRANGRDLILPDGKRLFLGSSGTGAPADGRDSTEK